MQKPKYIRILSLTASILLILTAILNVCNILHTEILAPYLIKKWSSFYAGWFENGSRIVCPSVIGSVLTFLPMAGYGIFHSCRKSLSSKSFWIFIILFVLAFALKWLFEEDFCWYDCTDTSLHFLVLEKVSNVLMIVNAAAGLMFLYGSFCERKLIKQHPQEK